VIVHLGRTVSEVDSKQAAHENRIVVCLQKRGPMRENDVKLYTAATRRVGREVHVAAVENLVAQGVIRKLTTTRANSFVLELVPDSQTPISEICMDIS
jgi:superfamily I DNA and RNA helicase